MAELEIGVVDSDDTFVIAGTGIIVHATQTPAGSEVVGGGFKVENLTTPALSMAQVIENGPSATDEWQVRVQPNAAPGDNVRLTVYASYVKVS